MGGAGEGSGRAVRTGAGLAILALSSASRTAQASNQEAVFLGNQAAMSGGAVVAWVNDGGAPWYNPAGLATIQRTSVDLSASAFVLRYYRLPHAARTTIDQSVIEEDASFTEVVSVPAALTVMRKLTDDLSGALSVFVPYQEDLLVSGNFARSNPSFDYEWSFSASRRAARYYAGPALGLSLGRGMHLGLSLFGTYETRLTARDFYSSLAATGRSVSRATNTLDQKLDNKLFGTNWVLGWRWDVDDAWSAGVVLRSPLFHVAGKSDLDYSATVALADPGGQSIIQSQSGERDQEPKRFAMMEPGRIQVGVSRKLAGGRLSAQVEYASAATGGGDVRKPVVNGRIGGAFPVSERLSLGGGLFTDRSPNDDARDLGETKIDFYGGSFGGQFRTSHDVQDEEGEEDRGLVFSTTVAIRYAVGVGDIGGLSFAPAVAPQFFVAGVTVHELSLHIGSALDF